MSQILPMDAQLIAQVMALPAAEKRELIELVSVDLDREEQDGGWLEDELARRDALLAEGKMELLTLEESEADLAAFVDEYHRNKRSAA